MNEEYKKHPFWTNYEVSNLGSIRNITTKKVSKQNNRTSTGHRPFNVSHNGEVFYTYIHRMVAETFINGFDKSDRVSFKNGDPSNCSLDNLVIKKTKNSRKTYEDMNKIAKLSESEDEKGIHKGTGHSYQFIRSSLLGMSKQKGWKARCTDIAILGILCMDGPTPRKSFPNLVPSMKKEMVQTRIRNMIKDGKVIAVDGVLHIALAH